MLTSKRWLVASTAALLGAGAAFTTVYAQQATPPQTTPPGNPPVPGVPGQPTVPGQPGAPAPQAFVSNFRRDADVSVMQRPREGYEALGIHAGTFLVYPQLTIAPTYDDNIYATSSDTTSDTIWKVDPQITIQSDWNRHSLMGYAIVDINKYSQHSTEDVTNYTIGANGRLDVDHATQVTGTANYIRGTEPRTSANSPTGALKPVRYDLWDLQLSGSHEFNWLLGSLRIRSDKYRYDSPPSKTGGGIDQSFRDHTETVYGGRLDYAISPKTAVFADLEGDNFSYDHQPAGDVNRDSDGYQALVGVDFEVTALMRGNIGVGYRHESFNDPAAQDLKGWSADARLEWFPTQLTTVTLTGTRTIQPSAIPGSPAFLSANATARVDHELLRNVILTGQVGYGDDKYTGITREDHRTYAGLGGTYLLNRNVGVTLQYDYDKQKTVRGFGNDFTDNRVAAKLTFQY